MCEYVHMRAGACGVEFPGPGIAKDCDPLTVGAGNELGFSEIAVSALNHRNICSTLRYIDRNICSALR